jgi:hypothetical protein
MSKKRIIFSLLVIFGLVLTPLQSARAQYSGCPSTWNLKIADLKLTLDKFGRTRITFSNDVYPTINPVLTLSKYALEADSYIKSLGQNAISTLSIQVSDRQDFQSSILDSDRVLGAYYGGSMSSAFTNAISGIPADPWLRMHLKVEIKNCPTFVFTSGSVQFIGNYKLQNVESYFSNPINAQYWNFKQQELLRVALKSNYDELLKPETLNRLLNGGRYVWQTTDDSSLSGYTTIGLFSYSPFNCMKKVVALGIRRDISFNSLPCKVGVMVQGGDADGVLIQIMDFKATPTTTPTVKPTPTPTQNTTLDQSAVIANLTNQLASLNSQIISLEAQLKKSKEVTNSAVAKLKKICSVKPKPKGC